MFFFKYSSIVRKQYAPNIFYKMLFFFQIKDSKIWLFKEKLIFNQNKII